MSKQPKTKKAQIEKIQDRIEGYRCDMEELFAAGAIDDLQNDCASVTDDSENGDLSKKDLGKDQKQLLKDFDDMLKKFLKYNKIFSAASHDMKVLIELTNEYAAEQIEKRDAALAEEKDANS